MVAYTTIALRPKTKERLERYRIKDESYDKLINRLLEETLPRQWPTREEIERRIREDEYVPLEEVIEKLGL